LMMLFVSVAAVGGNFGRRQLSKVQQ
jgi:hypothetical protein